MTPTEYSSKFSAYNTKGNYLWTLKTKQLAAMGPEPMGDESWNCTAKSPGEFPIPIQKSQQEGPNVLESIKKSLESGAITEQIGLLSFRRLPRLPQQPCLMNPIWPRLRIQ